MPSLAFTEFNIACVALGGFASLFGLLPYLYKEFVLSEALISLVAGTAISPSGFSLIDPLHYADGSADKLRHITLSLTRLVLGFQLVLFGFQLPSRYLLKEWRYLALLLGPGMVGMWLCSSVVIYLFVPNLPLLHAMAIAACVTPTDPILSNTITSDNVEDDNARPALQRLIIAESGASTGLGYIPLFLAWYLVKYTGMGGSGEGGLWQSLSLWSGETWLYTILLSGIYGAAIGWTARQLLCRVPEKDTVGRGSTSVFAIALALFVVGTCGMIGGNDVLACFVAGNAFNMDDSFREEDKPDSMRPSMNMMPRLFIFMWIGLVAPWPQILSNDIISIRRVLCLGIGIILLRRIPVLLALYKNLRQEQNIQNAVSMGLGGHIGVGAILYLSLSLRFLQDNMVVDGHMREDVNQLAGTMYIVVWSLVLWSVFIHGVSIPLGNFGQYIFRAVKGSLNRHRPRHRAHAVMIHRSPSSGLYLYPPPSPENRFLRGILSVFGIWETPTGSREDGFAERGLRSSLLLPEEFFDPVGSRVSIASRASGSGYGALRSS